MAHSRFLAATAGLLMTLAASAPALAADCQVTPGGDGLVLEALPLSDDDGPRMTQVLVGGEGLIDCVGPDCLARKPNATRIRCPDAVLSPGFVNPHEHLMFTHIAPRPDDGVPYGHRHDWRKGLRGHVAREDFKPDADPDTLAWGEIRHMLSGTTSMIGGAMAPGLVRNLDVQAGLEGLDTPRASYAVFPLDDASGQMRTGDCDYGRAAATSEGVAALHAYVAHIGEGTDDAARNEFRCLTDRRYDTVPAAGGGGVSQDLIRRNVAIVHGVALSPAMLREAADRHVKIVWSPRSNLSLYGATLDVRTALADGVVVALGTDWLPTGSFTMAREAACAQAYATATGAPLPARTLWMMMTLNGAKAVGMEQALGAIRPGLAADLILVARRGKDPYEAVVTAASGDLMLVLRGGRLLAGDADLSGRARLGEAGCEHVDIAGAAKIVCVARDTGKTYGALAEAMTRKSAWPAAFSGAPPVEPPCVANGANARRG